jgi:hypothetical protein
MEAASDFGKELLKSVGAVCWTLYEPSHIRRVAQAEADAQHHRAMKSLDTFNAVSALLQQTPLGERAVLRLAAQALQQEIHIEKVVRYAIEHGEEMLGPLQRTPDSTMINSDACWGLCKI